MNRHGSAPRPGTGRVWTPLLLATFLIVPAPATAQEAEQERAPDIELRVDGLACPFCAQGLEKKLMSLEGTERVTVLLDDSLVRVWTLPGSYVEDDPIEKAVKDAGFLLREIRRRPPS